MAPTAAFPGPSGNAKLFWAFRLATQLLGSSATSSHHFVHGHPQPTGADALTNQPYEPCCRRNEAKTTRVRKGGEKSAAADHSVANASTESRENKMRTITGSYRGGVRLAPTHWPPP